MAGITCTKCGETKDEGEFSEDKRRSVGRVRQCKDCRHKLDHKYQLKKAYGLKWEDYERMWKEQQGVCAICERPETSLTRNRVRVRRLAVDHCHDKGHVRALLCVSCNIGLGNFRHTPELLRKAAAYLEEHAEPADSESSTAA